MQNFKRERKFDPIFLPDRCVVCAINENSITVKNEAGRIFERHPDQLKIISPDMNNKTQSSDLQNHNKINNEPDHDNLWNDLSECQEMYNEPFILQETPIETTEEQSLRRSTRTRTANKQYPEDQWTK